MSFKHRFHNGGVRVPARMVMKFKYAQQDLACGNQIKVPADGEISAIFNGLACATD